jgi:Ankyrin repeats (many copies)
LDVITACCSGLDDAKAVKVVKLLLPHCSSFAANSWELGSQMLRPAVFRGKLRVARLLHAAGADVHTSGVNGADTLMHSAASSGSLAVAKWLQSLGLDTLAPCGQQLLPLHRACQDNHVR